jgi:hypothetical protein
MHNSEIKPTVDSNRVKFEQWLATLPSIDTPQIAESLYFLLQRLEKGHSFSLDDLRKIQTLYPQGLLNNLPNNPETLASLLSYLIPRLPLEVLDPKLVEIHLSNDCQAIMNIPTQTDQDSPLERKAAPKRSRWAITSADRRTLTFQSRDIDPADPTDGFEILSWLGSLEQVRQTALLLLRSKTNIDEIYFAFKKGVEEHLKSQITNIEKMRWVMEDNAILEEKLAQIQKKLEQIDEWSKTLFQSWISKTDQVELNLQHHQQFRLDRRNQDNTANQHTAAMVAQRLKEQNLSKPTDILFGNDFSLRILFAIGLFNSAEFTELENLLRTHLTNEDWSIVEKQIQNLLSSDLKIAAKMFFIVQQLSIYQGNNKDLLKYKRRIYQQDTFDKIALKRIISTSESPIADPVDILDFAHISPEIIENLPSAIQQILHKLIRQQQVILSVPYVLGNLTKSLLLSLLDQMESINGIGFIGKVGCVVDGNGKKAEVGNLVLPHSVRTQFGDNEHPVPNQIQDTLGYPTEPSNMMTTLALTLQEPSEMRKLKQELSEQNGKKLEQLSLDVELSHLMDAYWHLSPEQRRKISLYLLYYISDTTALPEIFEQTQHNQEKISQPLGVRGSTALFVALYTVLCQLGEK